MPQETNRRTVEVNSGNRSDALGSLGLHGLTSSPTGEVAQLIGTLTGVNLVKRSFKKTRLPLMANHVQIS